ncbi:putative protein of unknown function (DUF4586) [Trypanosoma vivax]|nr:hypothetical protein TRVL_07054 [Trypanosoma vivax]KAH8609708.1 putative protein of unknown function (DUF4586) [Trypanosoma vivax]
MVFSTPSFLGLGDRPKRVIDERARGMNFLVPRSKTGHNPDALFDKEFRYMYNGDRRADPETMARREEMEKRKRFMTQNGFLPVGRPQKSEGLGSNYGLLQKAPYPHMPEHLQTRGPKPFPTPQPRQFFTSPGKLGSYGTPGLGISDVGTEYIATIYDQPRINAKKERDMWRSRMPAVPFKHVGRRGYTFDESIITGASLVYMMTRPFQPKRVEAPMKHFIIETMWRPAGYLDDRPAPVEYREDPYGGFDPRVDPKSRIKKPSETLFRSGFRGDNFYFTQSIVFKRL